MQSLKAFRDVLYLLVFVGWNTLFLGFVYLIIVPFVLPFLFITAIDGSLPLEFSFTLIALVLVPTACTWIGARYFGRHPVKLMQLFYGVEAPLFVLCLVRLFLLREVTPAGMQILYSLSLCLLAYLWMLMNGYAEQQPKLAWAQLLAHSLMLLAGVYTGILLLFYAVPLAIYLVFGFFSWFWVDALRYYQAVWAILLFFLSASLFVILPPAMAALYIHAGQRILKAFAAQYGQKRAIAGASGVIAASLALFVGFQQQPQVQAFSLLEQPIQTDVQRQTLLTKSETIRQGLVNAYLSNYRYLSSDARNNHIRLMYAGLQAPDWLAVGLQNAYNGLMSPFLYKGEANDAQRAEKLYAEFFDTSIQKGEQATINHALQSTHNRDEAKAGALNLNERKVWLRSQDLTVTEQSDWAEVELHEVYENQTPENQEVLYYFTLPESAVVTGLWLGDTGDRAKRFPHVVSPRGAAQKVYNQQVRRQVDPALLEQVGPRHYRLRAFPIPVKLRAGERFTEVQRPTEMHLWLTYKVLWQEKGWALPVLGEKRNIFWTGATKRTRNGQSVNVGDNWLEAYRPATHSASLKVHAVDLMGDRVTAQLFSERDYTLPKNQRFAVLLDSSYSMATQRQAVQQTFDWLKQQGFANNRMEDNDADLYITAATGAKPRRIDDLSQFNLSKIPFYGTLQPKEMLRQFDQLRGDTRYDGILLVTDAGSYELANDKKELPKVIAPLWFVHLGAFSPAYDDTTLKAIQDSGGGVATQVSEVLQRLATQTALGSDVISVVDNYVWRVAPNPDQSAPQKYQQSRGFEPIAARQLILGFGRQKDLTQLENLDAIHAIAKQHSLVTPYSSMLVLVNDNQRAALKEAEAKSDRFDRTVESGNEDLTKPFNPLAQPEAVPEPSTVVGIGMVTFAFLWYRWRQSKAIVR
jgi:putative PEP-CTERM system integral membrane protein